jgi:hypothetical protein
LNPYEKHRNGGDAAERGGQLTEESRQDEEGTNHRVTETQR